MVFKLKNNRRLSAEHSPQTVSEKTDRKKLWSTSAFKSLGKRFSRDESGNIAIMFGAGSLLMFTLTGLAVDFTRYNLVRGDLIEAMDAAGLAMAQYSALNENVEDGELIEFGRNFFFENFKYHNLIDDLNVTFQISPTTIRPIVQGTLDAIILSSYSVGDAEFNFNNFDMMAETEITKRGAGRIELSLVLDVTGSMNNSVGNSNTSKLEDMKESVNSMLNTLYGTATHDPNIRISVVPFNAHVNVGNESDEFNTAWLDTTADAFYHGHRFIHVDEVTDPSQIDMSNGARQDNFFGTPMIINPNRKVNHFELFNSNTNFSWAGCVEARPYPLDELDTPPNLSTDNGELTAAIQSVPDTIDTTTDAGERTDEAFDDAPSMSLSVALVGSEANSRWVPMFEPDTPNCTQAGSACFGLPSSQFRSHNFYGFPYTTRIRSFFYDNPGANGHNNGHYGFTSYVNDQSYADDGAGTTRFLRYNDYNLAFRTARRLNRNDGSYWAQVSDAFERVGALSFGVEEYIARSAYVGFYNESDRTYDFAYDNSVNLNLNTDSRNPNRHCPDQILPLTDSRDEVESMVNDLVARGDTNSAFGAMWGWRTLSPQAPFEEGVSYDDPDWQKAIVIMTDGENLLGSRNTHWESSNSAFGFASEERMGNGINSSAEMRDEIDNKMLRICQRMKDEGILVYTIIFGLESDRAEELYRACATEPDAPYFHDASNGVDLEEAFGSIATDLVDLHISQ